MSKPPGIPNELFAYERKKRHWTQGDVADKISAPDERLIRRWERGEVAPSPHYRGKLAEVFGKSARALGFPPDGQISFWHVPYRRNAFFTGREDILQLLRDTFLAQHTSPVPRLPLALSGLGGVGKSHIAIEYAYRYREHYHTVLWLHAASYEGLVADVTAIADLLDLSGKDDANPDRLMEALKAWLTQLTRWLLIFDNVADWQLLEGLLPAEVKGHLLLTTRSQNTGTHAHRIAVEPMDNNTGAELLLRRGKLMAIESTLKHVAGADAAIARSLSADMGGLALALDQAGAYIEETAVSLSEYVQRYQEERRNLLDRRGSWVSEYSEHPTPVAATLKLSCEKAYERHPIAGAILLFCAFLQPDAIPEELFQHESFKYGTTVFDEAIAALLRYSLIKRNTQENTLSMHRLVQAVLIDTMPTVIRKQCRKSVFQALRAAFPIAKFTNWRQCERLLPHTLVCATWTEDELAPTVEVAGLFENAGIYLWHRGQYSVAETLLTRALSIYEQCSVETSIASNIAVAQNNLAGLYFDQDKYEQAERLFQHAYTINKNLLGAEHPDTIKCLFNLATLCVRQGKYDLGGPLLVGVLYIQGKLLGAEHPDTAMSLYMLGVLYYKRGMYKMAMSLYLDAFTIWDKHRESEPLGSVHPYLGLAHLLYRQEQHEQAEPLFQHALSILQQHLGPEHPHTKSVKKTYADLLHSIGRDEDVAALEMNDEIQYNP